MKYDINVLTELIEEHYYIYGLKIHDIVEHMNKLHGYSLSNIEEAFNQKCQTCGKTFYQSLIDEEDKQICKHMGEIKIG